MACYFLFHGGDLYLESLKTIIGLVSVNDPQHIYLRHGKGSKCILGRSKLYQEFVIIQFASLSPMLMDKERTLSERRGKPPACDLIPGGGRGAYQQCLVC